MARIPVTGYPEPGTWHPCPISLSQILTRNMNGNLAGIPALPSGIGIRYGCQVSGAGYLAPGTRYLIPNRRRGSDTEHRRTRPRGLHPYLNRAVVNHPHGRTAAWPPWTHGARHFPGTRSVPILHPASYILHRASCILYPVSCIPTARLPSCPQTARPQYPS
jgi:hypothetical protein